MKPCLALPGMAIARTVAALLTVVLSACGSTPATAPTPTVTGASQADLPATVPPSPVAATQEAASTQYEDFDAKNFDLESSVNINNEWFPMKPGTQFVYEGVTDVDGKSVPHKSIFTITDLTKVVEGVRTVVIWDQDFDSGKLAEAEIALFAQAKDGNIWHFGQYPEVYENGKLVETPAWIAGIDGARPGITIKAQPHLGGPSYSQGWGPSVNWTDRARVIQTGQELCIPLKCYKDVIVTEETSVQEVNAAQLKYYARGVGPIKVGWRGADESKEKMELSAVVQLDAAGLATARGEALKIEQRAYESSKDVYGKSAPAVLPPGITVSLDTAAATAPQEPATVVSPKLLAIEVQVEDIMDVVPDGDWAKAGADIADVEATWADYKTEATKDGAAQSLLDNFGQTLTRLKTAVTANDAAPTLQLANDLSALVVDLYDVYHPAEPTDLGRLDVLERQVILDIDGKDFAKAAATMTQINETWARVKPYMMAHNATAAATQFEASLAVQATALKSQDTAGLKREALNALEIVDALEKAIT